MRMKHERRLLVVALFSMLVLMVFGTFLFQIVEGWSALNAFYFTAMTMLTIGYGDIAPMTPAGKISSVLFGFIAVGIGLYSVNLIARLAFRQQLENFPWMTRRIK